MITVKWFDHEREPQCAPDPRFPEGIDVDLTKGKTWGCKVKLPYPAKRCGVYIVACDICGLMVGVTTAGRPDDPRSVRLACKGRERSHG